MLCKYQSYPGSAPSILTILFLTTSLGGKSILRKRSRNNSFICNKIRMTIEITLRELSVEIICGNFMPYGLM